ncbi:hypothetical protein CVT26_007735 [Gymnopilus dilepis]|uniref:P-loop containing nucleoside triphosphate hydrolase protein n=1 Tax=Gymnopilus dilepis TaxID=231916 RepID=A0A409W020_9AGAR|nr:hypothetical protein CVT26_007735 [Gymnopilus dilepis]
MLLSALSLFSKRTGPVAIDHAIVVWLSILGVYIYRDIWPLATYTLEPADQEEGNVLWVKIALVFIIAAVIPAFRPRPYKPVDPKNPMPVINPEITASWMSRFTYSYLNPLIALGNRVPHVHHDQLPPLADVDSADFLRKRAFHVSPVCFVSVHGILIQENQQHLNHFTDQEFLNLTKEVADDLGITGREYAIIATSIFLGAVCGFLAPTALNRVLSYLETGGAETTIRPWFWIVLLFCGPILACFLELWNMYIMSKVSIWVSVILTQLLFEHALRTRIVSEPSSVEGPESSAPSEQAKKKNYVGRITSLYSIDAATVANTADFMNFALQIPLQITFSMIFLYQILGWSSLVGLAMTIVFLPVPSYFARKLSEVQKSKMNLTDARVEEISELVNVLRTIKLLGWEWKMGERVREKREAELRRLWQTLTLGLLNASMNTLIPVITLLMTYVAYTVVMKGELNASKIFSTMAVLSILRTQVQRFSWRSVLFIQGKVSLDRVNHFLRSAELLDPIPSTDVHHQRTEIGFKDVSFAWSAHDTLSGASSRRHLVLKIEGEVVFKRNGINLIIGPTGSGKTSLLMALLGEMYLLPSRNQDAWVSLPREKGIAYAAQESWIQNATIRDNILFNSSYEEERYRKVLHQCALEYDLQLFEAGDLTEVGERGLTLSGGQKVWRRETRLSIPSDTAKARVTLARAIYSSSEIILLDDVLAALDVHTADWIVNKCLRGDLVRGRTILLVTHNVALVAPIADLVVSVDVDGHVKSQSTNIERALAEEVPASLKSERQVTPLLQTRLEESSQTPGAGGKLVVPEEIAQGRVTWKPLRMFISSLSGSRPLIFFATWVLAIIVGQWIDAFQVWFLGRWGSQYEVHHPSEINLSFYLLGFACIALGNVSLSFLTGRLYNSGVLRSSRVIHAQLIDSVFTSTFRWLDETPTGRIVARCTQDINALDGTIPQSLNVLVNESITMFTKLGAVVLFSPGFLLPGVGIAALGMYSGGSYVKSQLAVKRELSNARAPVIAQFNAAIQGLVSIRAYGAQNAFRDELMRRIDHYSRPARITGTLNRWIALRIDALGALFTASLAAYLVYWTSTSAANSGFSLTMALTFCSCLLYLVRNYNDLEVQSNSLERIQQYIEIEHEPKPTLAGRPPAAWPRSGDLRLRQFGPTVLENISFQIAPGQRIGVVGRTGSGKTSLTLALLRCLVTQGNVYYDGIDTSAINLDALRSNISIIPQTPELLSGTLRQNLDPFGEHDDAVLHSALSSAGLYSLRGGNSEDARLTLDSKISGGGTNLSVGERQIVSLARAIIRGSKLLILDEATSAIDYDTDIIIQDTLRCQFGKDVSVLTVAHRLRTVMDSDKIMVLDSGRIAEFGSPMDLLKKDGGIFKALVEGSGESQKLYSLAEAESSRARAQSF